MSYIGIQLYTVKDELEKDFLGTIRKVAALGYDGVEFSGNFYGTGAGEINQVLEETGLKAAGTCVTMDILQDGEVLGKELEFLREIGIKTVVCPWLDEKYRGGEESFRDTAAIFNRVGAQLKEQGFLFLYHIHGYEFEEKEGSCLMDVLLEQTDPQAVNFEIDTYWVEAAGVNAVEFVKEHGRRSPYVHLKDMTDRGSKMDIEVCDGVVGIPEIMRIAMEYKAEWLIVEQEAFSMPTLESAGISYQNIKKCMCTQSAEGSYHG